MFLRFNKALSRFWEGTHADDLPHELAQLQWLKDGEADSCAIAKRDLRKGGTIVWIRRTVSCVRHRDGSINYFVSVVEDISARKRAEERVYC